MKKKTSGAKQFVSCMKSKSFQTELFFFFFSPSDFPSVLFTPGNIVIDSGPFVLD